MHFTAWISLYVFGKILSDNNLLRLSPYAKPTFLDVGSYDINGASYRPLYESIGTDVIKYFGMDVEEGLNVDLVYDPDAEWPIAEKQFDVVLSTSCFEHDRFFWNTFTNMANTTRIGGFIFINVPSGGPIHRTPRDAWRFYVDSANILSDWAATKGIYMKVLVAYRLEEGYGEFRDTVMVFQRHAYPSTLPDEPKIPTSESANVIDTEGEISELLALYEDAENAFSRGHYERLWLTALHDEEHFIVNQRDDGNLELYSGDIIYHV
jgi:hypothetical protein